MHKKTVLWILFTLVFLAATSFAIKYFNQAFPIVNLDIQMDREQALDSAKELANRYAWGPGDFRQAAAFELDRHVQNFVELEVGGTAAFNDLLQSGLYSPYGWHIRHFKEGETNETLVRFTPAGEAYGFRETLAEDAPGAALTADSARAIAETAASENWDIDLSPYELIESSKEVRPGERIDHTFVYERRAEKIGDGLYRLRLVVSGDKLTELTHFVKIPEAFTRKYSEMRSANETISTVAMVGMVLIYLIGGCIIGLFFLLRQRWVIWKPALYWGVFIAFLQMLDGLNNLPLMWMSYDTALSTQGFLLQQIFLLLGNFLIYSGLFTLSFMAAESLSRKAFPHHVLFWRSWSRGAGGSTTILGRTVAAYWIIGLFFAFEVILYFIATRILGWWTPSEALFNPNVLASYFPWLTAIASSLQAGFWEESLFRAVPLAGAALLGQKYGRKGFWMAAALIIQTLIFSAAHANYPNQPAYARVVELIIPSLMFAAIYLWYGLLPGIILHFAYDVVWFALPLFVAKTPGIWVQQLIVVILALIPLWIVFARRLQNKKWTRIEESDLNRSWTPPKAPEKKQITATKQTPKMNPLTGRLLPAAAIIGVVLWILFSGFENYAPPLTLKRQQALEQAQEVLQQKGISLEAPWKTMSQVVSPLGQDDRFVWQTGEADDYRQLIGTYLTTPHWTVRYARFEGDVAERAEEFQATFSKPGPPDRFVHQWPEARPGDSLSVEAATALADSVVSAKFGLNPESLKQVSVEPKKRPARLDWTFTFADTANYPLSTGEARIGVEISGSEVSDAYRYIHVPEEWQRTERNKRNLQLILRLSGIAVIVIIWLIGVIFAIISWSKKEFTTRLFLIFAAIFLALTIVNLWNRWPTIISSFSTAQPFQNQVLIALIGAAISATVLAGVVGLAAGFAHRIFSGKRNAGLLNNALLGFGAGLFYAGLSAMANHFAPSLTPPWADYSMLSSSFPLLGIVLSSLNSVILVTAFMGLVFVGLDRLTANWTRRKLAATPLMLLLGLAVAAMQSTDNPVFWLISGVVIGLLLLWFYAVVFRFSLAALPFAAAAVTILALIKQALINAIPPAIPGAVIGIAAVLLLALFWAGQLNKEK